MCVLGPPRVVLQDEEGEEEVNARYYNGQAIQEDLDNGILPKQVIVVIETSLLVELLGQRFVGRGGVIASMESVEIRTEDAGPIQFVQAQPLIVSLGKANTDADAA